LKRIRIKVDFSDTPEKVYISVVFKKNKQVVDEFVSKYPNTEIDIGGSGYDLKKELPDYIENLKPDYSLYPEFDYSIGFSSRGCFRRDCFFCIVRAKEGRFHKVAHPETWYNPDYKKLVLLDNNILTNRKHFMRITDWCLEKNLKVWFTQGLDIRRVNNTIAHRLLELKHFKMISFAWDNINDEATIREKIDLLKRVGFTKNKLRAKVQFYVYVDSDSDEEYNSGVYRCRELKKLNCNAYVMYNVDNERTQRIKDLQRWSIRKIFYWINDIVDYKANIREAKTIRAKRAKAGVAET
jgi:hypothetical protein